jgi:hypothetical protein
MIPDQIRSSSEIMLTEEKQRSLREICCTAILSTIIPTLNNRGTKSGLGGEKPVTNSMSYVWHGQLKLLLHHSSKTKSRGLNW